MKNRTLHGTVATQLWTGRLLVTFILLNLAVAPGTKAAIHYQVIKSFAGTNGAAPHAGLLEGRDHALYGTTPNGGANGVGTLYKLLKDGSGYNVLHQFSTNAADGRSPYGRLIEGSDRAFYGTTAFGGASNAGTVFRVGKDGVGFAILHHFPTARTGGGTPLAGLLEDRDGVLYDLGHGFIFRMNKDGSDFVSQRGCLDGYPEGELLEGSDGAIYGAGPSICGGSECVPSGFVFQFDKDLSSGRRLLLFCSGIACGAECTRVDEWPDGGLLEGSDGLLYGTTDSFDWNLWDPTTSFGSNPGVLFSLNKDGSNFTILHAFGEDGSNPLGRLVEGRDGALYGTTVGGGSNNMGTVFKMNRNGVGYSILHDFSYGDGAFPLAGVVQGSDGAFYGTTYGGGEFGLGTVFRLSLNEPPAVAATVFPLVSFLPGETNLLILAPNTTAATVVLDGSQSSDADNDSLQFFWYTDGQTNALATDPVTTNQFNIGRHTVTLVVSDGHDAATTRVSFEVITPAAAVAQLVHLVEQADFKQKQPLIASLSSAQASFIRGNTTAALNQLSAFQSKVRAQGAPLDAGLADQLITAAQKIVGVTGG